MSALDYLTEYRVVQVTLPQQGGETTVVDGVALATEPPVFEVTFLADTLHPATIDAQSGCKLSFSAPNGSSQTLKAEIVKIVSDTKLQLRALENFGQTQQRAYFRVDADLSVSYWPLDTENTDARSVQTAVNLSGGGMRIPVKESLRKGSKVGLEIIIDGPHPGVIECTAMVVRSLQIGGSMQLALRYTDIEEEDRDALVAYCFAEQRKQLRLKVQVLGLEPS